EASIRIPRAIVYSWRANHVGVGFRLYRDDHRDRFLWLPPSAIVCLVRKRDKSASCRVAAWRLGDTHPTDVGRRHGPEDHRWPGGRVVPHAISEMAGHAACQPLQASHAKPRCAQALVAGEKTVAYPACQADFLADFYPPAEYLWPPKQWQRDTRGLGQ